jgi:hypothetical protein
METLTKDDESLVQLRVRLRRKAVNVIRQVCDRARDRERVSAIVSDPSAWDATHTLTMMRMSPRQIATYVSRTGYDEKVVLDTLARSVTANLRAILTGALGVHNA